MKTNQVTYSTVMEGRKAPDNTPISVTMLPVTQAAPAYMQLDGDLVHLETPSYHEFAQAVIKGSRDRLLSEKTYSDRKPSLSK